MNNSLKKDLKQMLEFVDSINHIRIMVKKMTYYYAGRGLDRHETLEEIEKCLAGIAFDEVNSIYDLDEKIKNGLKCDEKDI